MLMFFFTTGTAEALNILKITIPEMNNNAINAIGEIKETDFPMIKDKMPFPKIKGVKIHLSVKPNATPVQLGS